MSRKSNDWAWNQELKSASLKLTLLALADRTNEDHECWPSYDRLIKDTCLNRKTIAKNISVLVELGLLEDTGKRRGRTRQIRVYKFTFEQAGKDTSNETKNGTLKEPQKRNDTESGTLGKSTKNGTHNETKNGTLKEYQKRYSEPPNLLNHPIEPPKEKRGKQSSVIFRRINIAKFDPTIDANIAKQWITYRAAKKKFIADQETFDRQMNKAIAISEEISSELGMTPNDVITETIDAGWGNLGRPEYFRNKFRKQNNTKGVTSFEREEQQFKDYVQERERPVGDYEPEVSPVLGRTDGVKLL